MTAGIPDLPESIARQRVLTSRDAAAFCGFSVDHFLFLHRKGKTPPAVRLNERKLGWRAADLAAWIESRIQQAA